MSRMLRTEGRADKAEVIGTYDNGTPPVMLNRFGERLAVVAGSLIFPS
jgi:hypothetical protein